MFLNVDLDLQSGEGLTALMDAWAGQVIFLSATATELSAELTHQPDSPSDAISQFAQLVQRLPPPALEQWNSCARKVFSVGLQAGNSPHECVFILTLDALKAAATVGADIGIVVYGAS